MVVLRLGKVRIAVSTLNAAKLPPKDGVNTAMHTIMARMWV